MQKPLIYQETLHINRLIYSSFYYAFGQLNKSQKKNISFRIFPIRELTQAKRIQQKHLTHKPVTSHLFQWFKTPTSKSAPYDSCRAWARHRSISQAQRSAAPELPKRWRSSA